MTHFTKLAFGALFALSSTLFACSGGDGPTESEPGAESATESSVTLSKVYYTCSGTPRPCSDDEARAIISSPSFNRHTREFTLAGTTTNCEYICTPGSEICPSKD